MRRDDSVDVLSVMLHSLWEFPAFSGSRWVTVGTSCRVTFCSLLAGFGSFFTYLRERGVISDYEGNGVARMTREVRVACLGLGLVSYVPETMMSILLHASRLLQQVQACEDSVAANLKFLEDLGHPSVLRDLVVKAGHVAAGYLQRKIFMELDCLPWSILLSGGSEKVLGDIEALVDTSDDRVVAQFQAHSRMGFARSSLKQALELLLSISFTSHFTDKQHPSA
eukprot:4036932-Amphidinium_carterae.1